MNLFSLQWKESFRAPQWEAKATIKILIGVVSLYFIGSFLFLGSVVYPALNKTVLEREPLEVFNSVLLLFFFAELIIRFFFQQLPVTNIQSLILLPFKKRQIVNHVMLRSVFSPFNLVPFIIYLPFAISMYRDDYLETQALAWWLALLMTTLSLNFLLYIINKNNTYFVALVLLLLGTIALDVYAETDLGKMVGIPFDAVVNKPEYLVGFLLLLCGMYAVLFFFLKKSFYLDAGLGKKRTRVSGGEYTILNFLGDDALILRNDLRMIVRNARPRQIALMSFLFLFYGLVFFTQDIYRDMEYVMVFAGIFVTGGFTMTFGNYVPAWDSSYYKLLMTQNISYKKYLLSKWNLMAFVTAVSALLAIPYVYFGWDILAIVIAGAFFNIGLNTWVTLFGGLLNKTPMKLNVKAKAFENTQGFSMTQFVLIIPKMVLPVLLYWLPSFFISPTAGFISLAGSGIVAIILRDKIANWVTELYKKQKHETIEAFNK
ncbi:MAG: DUF5687 family protein [Flavobacteriaceae bacterium]|nr:DUF5687 family protein [Flavobacteriaceae bacterium]